MKNIAKIILLDFKIDCFPYVNNHGIIYKILIFICGPASIDFYINIPVSFIVSGVNVYTDQIMTIFFPTLNEL